MWSGSGSWTRIASTSSDAFSSASRASSSSSDVSAGQPDVHRVEARLVRRLVLEADVDLGGGIVADEHGDEADVADRARPRSATSARIRSASGLPLIIVAVIRGV